MPEGDVDELMPLHVAGSLTKCIQGYHMPMAYLIVPSRAAPRKPCSRTKTSGIHGLASLARLGAPRRATATDYCTHPTRFINDTVS